MKKGSPGVSAQRWMFVNEINQFTEAKMGLLLLLPLSLKQQSVYSATPAITLQRGKHTAEVNFIYL